MYMCIEVNCVLETVANIVVKIVMCVYILVKCRQMIYMYECVAAFLALCLVSLHYFV